MEPVPGDPERPAAHAPAPGGSGPLTTFNPPRSCRLADPASSVWRGRLPRPRVSASGACWCQHHVVVVIGIPSWSGLRATVRTQMTTIRVALAEDNVLLREGISRIIDAREDLDLVGTASDLPELLELIQKEEPDVVVTDIRMPPTGTDEGIQAASWLRENMPHVGVVVLSQFTAPAYALALLETGSAGRAYLLKERVAGADELAQAIHTVA